MRPLSQRTDLALASGICALALLDGVNAALTATIRPYLMGSFAASPDEIAWAAILYFSGKLAALLVSTHVSRRSGERAALLASAAALVIATAAAGACESLTAFLALQLAQGASGGFVLAIGQGALLKLFPQRASPIAQAFFAVSVLVFPVMIAPAAIGWTAYAAEWSYAAVLTALVGAVAWMGIYAGREKLGQAIGPGRTPAFRVALLLTALMLAVYGLLEGARYAWDAHIRMSLAAAAAALIAFTALEARAPERMVDVQCFRLADFTFGICVSLLAGAALLGSSTSLALLVGGSLRYTVSHAGVVQLWAAPFAVCALFTAAVLLRSRFPPPLLLLSGIVLLGFGFWRLGLLHAAVAQENLLAAIVLRGTGLGLLFLTLTMITLRQAPAEQAVAAAALFNFGRQLGGHIGISWIQTLHERLMSRGHEALAGAWAPGSTTFEQAVAQTSGALRQAGAAAADATNHAVAILASEFQQQTFAVALNGCFQALALLFVFAFPFVVLMRVVTERTLAHTLAHARATGNAAPVASERGE